MRAWYAKCSLPPWERYMKPRPGGVCGRQLAVWRRWWRWGRRVETLAASGRGYVLGASYSFVVTGVTGDCWCINEAMQVLRTALRPGVSILL